jgi:hypothetical protein
LLQMSHSQSRRRLVEELRPDVLGAVNDGADFNVPLLCSVEDQM